MERFGDRHGYSIHGTQADTWCGSSMEFLVVAAWQLSMKKWDLKKCQLGAV